MWGECWLWRGHVDLILAMTIKDYCVLWGVTPPQRIDMTKEKAELLLEKQHF